MWIGSLGLISFEVSKKKIFTFDDFNRQRSATFNEVARMNTKPALQFGGVNLDTISMKIYISLFLGANPLDELKKLHDILELGKEEPLMIGKRYLGDYVLESIDESWELIDKQGELKTVGVSITLKEYVA